MGIFNDVKNIKTDLSILMSVVAEIGRKTEDKPKRLMQDEFDKMSHTLNVAVIADRYKQRDTEVWRAYFRDAIKIGLRKDYGNNASNLITECVDIADQAFEAEKKRWK